MKATCLKTLLGTLAVILAMITGPWSVAQAAPPSKSSVLPYTYFGTVDYIDNQQNTIVIDDREFGFPVNVPVHSGTTTLSRNSLSKGMRVGFNLSDRMVSEIWVLPGR